MRSRYWKIWSRFFRTFRSSSWRSIACGEFGDFATASVAFRSRPLRYTASLP